MIENNLLFTRIQESNITNPKTHVFVKVINALGDGLYEVSFEGRRFSVHSEKVLEKGETFFAKTSVKNGVLMLSPIANKGSESLSTVDHLNTSFLSLDGKELSSVMKQYIGAMGLPLDALSAKILRLFVSAGLKLDADKAKKIRMIALHFPQKKALATELALVLEQKGIDPNPESIAKLLLLLEGGEFSHKGKRKKNVKDSILSKLFGMENALDNEVGLLTVCNHVWKKHSALYNDHWIIIPIVTDLDTTLKGKGSIRLLLDPYARKTKKICVFADFGLNSYFFVLHCMKSDYKLDIEFCLMPQADLKKRRVYETYLASLYGDEIKSITYNEELRDQAGFFDEALISLVRTEA